MEATINGIESEKPTRDNFCDDCGGYCTEKYLSESHLCQRCANIDKPCEYMAEPRGALGIAGGWCFTHNVGWAWCERAKEENLELKSRPDCGAPLDDPKGDTE